MGIANTFSELNSCHRLVPELVAAIKRGVLAAGGPPLEFPTASLGEVYLRPTSMVSRNLVAMETEERVRGGSPWTQSSWSADVTRPFPRS